MDTTYYTMDSTSYSTLSGSEVATATTAFAWMTGAVLVTTIILSILAYVFLAFCLSRIFKKAGEKPWIAWVPFYNTWKLLEIGDQKGAYIFLGLIPFVGSIILAVFMIIAAMKIGAKLGKSNAFVLLWVFLSPVWFIWLAFDKSTWNGGQVIASATPVTPTTPFVPQQPQQYAAPQQPQQYFPQQPQQMPTTPVTPVVPPVDNQQQPPQMPQQF